jgi:hypothetical protein
VGLLCARTHRCTELLDFTLLYNWTGWFSSKTVTLHLVGAWLESQVGHHPGWSFSWFSLAPLVKCWDSTSIRRQLLLPNLLQFIIRMSSYHLMLYSLNAESVVK